MCNIGDSFAVQPLSQGGREAKFLFFFLLSDPLCPTKPSIIVRLAFLSLQKCDLPI